MTWYQPIPLYNFYIVSIQIHSLLTIHRLYILKVYLINIIWQELLGSGAHSIHFIFNGPSCLEHFHRFHVFRMIISLFNCLWGCQKVGILVKSVFNLDMCVPCSYKREVERGKWRRRKWGTWQLCCFAWQLLPVHNVILHVSQFAFPFHSPYSTYSNVFYIT